MGEGPEQPKVDMEGEEREKHKRGAKDFLEYITRKLESEERSLSSHEREATLLLTKIAHILRPEFVPDVDSIEGKLSSMREGVAYEVPENEGDNDSETDPKTEEQIIKFSAALDSLGLTSRVETFSGDYSKSEDGKVKFVKPLVPWQPGTTLLTEQSLLFDPKAVKRAISRKKSLSTEAKKECQGYVDRIMALFQQEQREREEQLPDPGPIIQEFKLRIEAEKERILSLRDITSKKEALKSELRKSATLIDIYFGTIYKLLKHKTKIRKQEIIDLDTALRESSNIIGLIKRDGTVDHDR